MCALNIYSIYWFEWLCTHSSNLLKVAQMAAHEESSRSHEEVQHASGQDRNIWLLPWQRLEIRSGRFLGWDLIKVVLTSCVIEHYCGLCRYFQMTCKKSNKLSATSVSLAQSAENNTTRCSCRRQDSTYRDRDREMDSERHMKVNVSLLLFYSN